MIKLIDIEIEGFASIIKKTRYKFNIKGVNIIRGKNGSGKTSILNALCWCLYGKTIKKDSTINPWPILIDENYKGTMVTVRYKKDGLNRKITHCSEYKGKINGVVGRNRLIIEADGEKIERNRDKNDLKKWIIKDLGHSFDLFKSVVLLGQRVKKILDEDVAQRSKVLEEAFEVSYISEAKNKIEQTLRVTKPELDKWEKEISKDCELLEAYSNELDRVKETILNFEKEKERNIANYTKVLKKLRYKADKIKNNPKIKNVGDIKKDLNELRDKLKKLINNTPPKNKLVDSEFRLNMRINSNEGRKEETQDEIKSLYKSLRTYSEVCKECGAPLSEKSINKQRLGIKLSIKKSKKDLNLILGELKQDKKEYEKVNYDLSSLNKIKIRISKYENKIKKLEALINIAQKEKYTHRSIVESINTYKKLIKEEKDRELRIESKGIEEKIRGIKKEMGNKKIILNKLRDEYELILWLIKDPLSNSGLKSYIFDSMLKKTNKELIKYETLSGFRIKLGMNLESKKKDFEVKIYKKGQEVPITDLSGGQKQLGDVCIFLAIHDTTAENKCFNCLFMDEVFESLDEENTEKVGEIIQYKSKLQNLHIITHLNYFNPVGAHITSVYLNKKDQTIIKQ